jgi:hypothetical protein
MILKLFYSSPCDDWFSAILTCCRSFCNAHQLSETEQLQTANLWSACTNFILFMRMNFLFIRSSAAVNSHAIWSKWWICVHHKYARERLNVCSFIAPFDTVLTSCFVLEWKESFRSW